MRLINRIHIHGVLPGFDKERYRGLGRRMTEFGRWERLSQQEAQNRQLERLGALLRHAYATTPFYRDRFQNAGFDPSREFDPTDLKHLPPLTRDDIRRNVAEMCSSKYRSDDLSASATGGTTDTPVKFYRDRESVRQKLALQLQLDTWAGMYPGDKVFYLWGARSDYSANPSWRWSIYDRYIMRRRWAPTSIMTAETAEAYRQDINQFKPRIIYAYPTPLALFCEYLRESGKRLHRPIAAICTAESVLESQRQVIENVLGCRLFVHYGAREFGMIAAECPEHAGLHFATPAAYVEFVPVPDSDEEGLCEIFVTDLLNYGMPLIRYRVNDCAIVGDNACPCGRSYPLVSAVMGRTADIFELPDGSKVPGVALTNRVLQVCPTLKKIQIVQETLEDFTVRFVPEEGSGDGVAVLRNNLSKFFPSQVRWKFEQVSDVAREPSGKTRFCISKLSPNQQALSTRP